MAPLYDWQCNGCGHEFEQREESSIKTVNCPHCDTNTAQRLPSLFGGYQGNFGGSSTRPKQSGSFRGKREKA